MAVIRDSILAGDGRDGHASKATPLVIFDYVYINSPAADVDGKRKKMYGPDDRYNKMMSWHSPQWRSFVDIP